MFLFDLHPCKVLFTGERCTKADAAAYYRTVADRRQNARGHHAVPHYVLRAVSGATVSTPLRWADLTADLDPKRFTIEAVPARLARPKADPLNAPTKGT